MQIQFPLLEQETPTSDLRFDGLENPVAELLCASQNFMRKQEVGAYLLVTK